jgi:hypothetical protein
VRMGGAVSSRRKLSSGGYRYPDCATFDRVYANSHLSINQWGAQAGTYNATHANKRARDRGDAW